ncbi:hypothetical protein V5O48_007637 [Marasmius crinis-equi]|uniref:Rhodopsin domain-containing protein n=1 Tax=Marasmius crinis-equi TaxID=585013 RepID=A0ABR3FG59_9AGAR
MVKDPSLTQVRVTGTIGSSIAIFVTLIRLSIRVRRRNIWWDDLWAGLAMIGIIIFMTGILIFTDPPGNHGPSVKVAGYYMVDNGFYAVIWCARASLFLTLVRMAFGRLRTFLKWCVAATVVTYAVLFAQVFWTCERQPHWKDQVVAQCMLGKKVAIAQLITDCLFDAVLVACPIFLLSGMKQRKGLKIRLIAVFSSTVFTTAFSLAHAWAIIEDRGLLEFMLAACEVFVSLIVVNLTVIVSWLFKISDDSTEEHNIQMNQMNTFIKGRISSRRTTEASQTRTLHRHLSAIRSSSKVSLPHSPDHIHIQVTRDKVYDWETSDGGSPLSFANMQHVKEEEDVVEEMEIGRDADEDRSV